MSATTWVVSGLQEGNWTYHAGPDINPVPPTTFNAQHVLDGLQVFCSGPPYSGALVSQDNKIPAYSKTISLNLLVKLDQSIAYGQVIEIDTKFTDLGGWTYDGSLQFNRAKRWMVQVDNPWVDTGLIMPLLPGDNPVEIVYGLDWAGHTIAVLAVNGKPISNPRIIPAKQINWGRGIIHTQLQLCIASAQAAYDVTFGDIEYEGAL